MKARENQVFVIVFLLAAMIRIIFAFQWAALPYAQAPYLDAMSHDHWARAIADGHWLRAKAFYQSPLYPYILALVYKLFGTSGFVVSILQALMDAATCALLCRISSRAFGWAAGLLTGILAALYAPMIFYSAPLMKETLGLFCLTLFLHFFQYATEGRRERWVFIGSGVSLGLAVLVRSNALVLAGAAILFALILWRRTVLKGLFWFTVALGLTILPATAHNLWVSHDFVLVNYGGGFNFFVGHWREATGTNYYPPEVSTDPSQEEADVTRIANDSSPWPVKPSEVSHYWFHLAMNEMLENPRQELALLFNKSTLFWNDYEQPDNYNSNFVRSQFHTVLSLPLVTFALISALALLSALILVRTHRFACFLVFLAATYFGSVALFYVTDRYRLPVVVFLLPLAGASWTAISERVQARRFLPICFAALVALLYWRQLGARDLFNPHDQDSYNWGLVSSLYADARRDPEAIAAIEKAQELKPFGVTQQALIKSADSYERMGRLSDAEKALQSAVELYPKDGLTYHNLGRFYHDHSRFQEAREQFTKSISIAPWNYQPYVGLALTDAKLHLFGEAAWAVQQGERITPDQYDWQRLRDAIGKAGR